MPNIGSYWSIYRGTVFKVVNGNIYCNVPQLGTGSETGPWEWIGTDPPQVNDRVLLGSPSQQFDDLVIIGVLNPIGATTGGSSSTTTISDPTGVAGLDAFMYGERMQESGGDYTVVNSIGAAGAYQMITSTWRAACAVAGVSTGTYPTANTAPPSVQDQVAAAYFLQYYNGEAQHSWPNVSCCWYVGHLIPQSEWASTGNPTVADYVSGVATYMANYPGASSSA